MNSKYYTIIIVILLISTVLTACAGGATTATSWPGLTADDQYAYVAYQNQVYAINLENGREAWRYPSGDSDTNATFYADPSLSEDGQLIVGGYDGVLYSLETDTGRLSGGNWPFEQAAGRYIASALVVEENIYAPAADDNLYNVDLDGNGQVFFSSVGESWAQPVIDGSLYLSSMKHTVYAIDPVSGSQIWQSPQLGGSVVGSPAVSENDILYVGTFGGKMFALDGQDGSILWEFPTEDWIWSGPTLDNDVLYFGDLDGNLYAVDAEDGQQIWRITPEQFGFENLDEAEIVGTPLILEEHIYVATSEGSLFKIDTSGDIIDEVNVDPADNRGKIFTSPITSNGLILVAPIQIDELVIAYDQNLNEEWPFIPSE